MSTLTLKSDGTQENVVADVEELVEFEVELEDGEEDHVEEKPAKKPAAADDDDGDEDDDEDEEKSKSASDEDDDEDDDGEEGDDALEAKRARRRAERAEKKDKRKAAERAVKDENRELKEMILKLSSNVEAQRATQVLSHLAAQREQAETTANRIAAWAQEAAAKGNVAGFQKAMADHANAKNYIAQLEHQAKAVREHGFRSEAPQTAADSKTVQYAKAFMDQNPWFDHTSDTLESTIIRSIEKTLVKEGFKQNTRIFWDTLRKRAARRLPEYFGRQEEEDKPVVKTQAKPKTIIRSGAAGARNVRVAATKIPKTLIDSMDQAGVKDPATRQAIVKKYLADQKSKKK